jgi:Sigma-70 region 3
MYDRARVGRVQKLQKPWEAGGLTNVPDPDARRFAPYTGSVKAAFATQVSDHCNAPMMIMVCPASPGYAATNPLGGFTLPITIVVGCAPGGMGIGSTCAVTTTANVLFPGLVVAGQRANFEVGPISDSIKRRAQPPVSLEMAVGDDKESELGQFIPDKESESPYERAAEIITNDALREALEDRRPRIAR